MSTLGFDFAFFWRGNNIDVPTHLVRSIRHVYGSAAKVIQLTDMATPEVAGVSEVQRNSLNPNIMLARLEACSMWSFERPTVFLDADMLVIADFELPAIGEDEVVLTLRSVDFPINPDYPEHYPEFIGKTICQLMPFLFSFIATTNGNLFVDLLRRAKALPERFHRWYADQVALKQAFDDGAFVFKFVSEPVYNNTVKTSVTDSDLRAMRQAGVKILHFKGLASKQHQGVTCKALMEI